MTKETALDWLIVVSSAALGVAARLSHSWSQAAEKAEKEGRLPRNLSFGEVIAALITAPALGIIADGIGSYFQMPDTVIAAMAGFAGLAGPGALLALWDALVKPVVKRLRP